MATTVFDTSERPPTEPHGESAALLQNLIGAVLSGIVQAQSQADLTTIGVAMSYAQSQPLAHFPICRASMQEIEFTAHVALVADSPSLTPYGRMQLASLMTRQVTTFLDRPPLRDIIREYPQLIPAWFCAMPRTMENAGRVLDRARAPEADVLANELLLVLMNAFFAVVAEFPEILQILRPRFPAILEDVRKDVLPQLRDEIATILEEANAVEAPVRVLFGADALASLPPSAIDQVRIRVLPQSRQLVNVEGQLRVSVE